MELPSAEDYPDYYSVIDNPMCMTQIKRKKYASLDEFRRDCITMFDNAKEYNEATSQVYADASTLTRLLEEECGKHLKALEGGGGGEAEETGNDDDDSSVQLEVNDDEIKKKRGRPKKEKSAKREARKAQKEEEEGEGEGEEGESDLGS